MKIKSIPAKVKAAGETEGLALGQFSAYASVFGNVDSYGDVVHKGAFSSTLKEWSDSGKPVPVYWSHQMGGDPFFNLGHVLTAEEDSKGLLVTAQLDVEGNEKAAYVYRMLKGRRVDQMSFAYDVLDGEDREGGGQDLKELRLHEVSVVPIGANSETEILDVKSALRESIVIRETAGGRFDPSSGFDPLANAKGLLGVIAGAKAGRTLSAKNETTLRAAADAMASASAAINDVLSTTESAVPDPEKASGKGPVKDEGATSVKSEEPRPIPSVDSWSARLNVYSL